MSNEPFDLSKCPRCGNDWMPRTSNDFFSCSSCNTVFFEYDMTVRTHWLASDGYITMVYWLIAPHLCKIYKAEQYTDATILRSGHDVIARSQLPWLPFDITEGRLKKLLVFS